MNFYAYSTEDQTFTFEGKEYTFKKDDLYHIVSSRRFYEE